MLPYVLRARVAVYRPQVQPPEGSAQKRTHGSNKGTEQIVVVIVIVIVIALWIITVLPTTLPKLGLLCFVMETPGSELAGDPRKRLHGCKPFAAQWLNW